MTSDFGMVLIAVVCFRYLMILFRLVISDPVLIDIWTCGDEGSEIHDWIQNAFS